MNTLLELPNEEIIYSFKLLIDDLNRYITLQDFNDFEFDLKNDDSPVSDLDFMIEAFFRKKAATYLPKFQVIGEEFPFSSTIEGNYLVIDPIDGTENFISGIPIWGVGVALFFEDRLLASWVNFPEISLEFSSSRLRELTGDPKMVARKPLGMSRVVAYSSNSNWRQLKKKFPKEIRVFGSSLFNLMLASVGAVDYVSSRPGVKIWDFAPCVLFALESGKSVTINGEEYFGQFLDPNIRYLVEISNK
jgi:myo-inositol-1(or 4)-monophosphatase